MEKKLSWHHHILFWLRLFTVTNAKHHFHVHFFQRKKKMKRNYSCICGVRPEKVFGPKNALLGTPALFDTTYILSGRPILMIQGVPFRNLYFMKIRRKVEENRIK